MKTPGAVYRQYRQTRKLALLRAVSASRQRTHDNCFYGKVVRYKDSEGRECLAKICMLKEGTPDICTCPGECNAFARRWSDEEVAGQFSKILSDDSSRKKMFPELWAYEWVLDKSLTEAKKSPKLVARPIVWAISILESILKAVNGKKSLVTHGDKDAKA